MPDDSPEIQMSTGRTFHVRPGDTLIMDRGYIDVGVNGFRVVATDDDPPEIRLGRTSLTGVMKVSFDYVRGDGVSEEVGQFRGGFTARNPITERIGGLFEWLLYDNLTENLSEDQRMRPVLEVGHDRGIVCHLPIHAPNLQGLGYGSRIALRAQANGRFVCADDKGDAAARPLIANRDEPRGWETFTLERPR